MANEQPVPGEIVKYQTAVSAGKATKQTLISVGALLLTVASMAIADPTVGAQLAALIKDHPQLLLLFGVLRMGLGIYQDRIAHRGQQGELVDKAKVEVPVVQGVLSQQPLVVDPAAFMRPEVGVIDPARAVQRQLHGERKTCPDAACGCGLPKRLARPKPEPAAPEVPRGEGQQ